MIELARQHTETAIQRLAEWAASDNAKASVAACTALLDRAWGRPTQVNEFVNGGQPFTIQIVTGVPRAPDDPAAD